MKTKSENITDVFTLSGIQKLKKDQLLRFDMEGSITEYIITYLNKKTPRVMARRVITYTPDQVSIDGVEDGEKVEDYLEKQDG